MKLVQMLGAAAVVSFAVAGTAAQAETAVFAGGCFWGMEAVFEHVKGVTDVVSGYAGGSASDARYGRVSSETTGNAEAVRINYDTSRINYGQLLQLFFTVAHDPTQVNRQGPDTGPSYRSAIFPQNPGQKKAARLFIEKVSASGAYKQPIATRIESGLFFPAEAEHQDYARRNPFNPYILVNDRPKVAALKRQYPSLYKG